MVYALPKVRVPRSWKKERIVPTHFLPINCGTRDLGNGELKITVDIPTFGDGWRLVRLEKLDKRAHVVECGTGVRRLVDLDVWNRLVKAGKEL